MEYGLTGLHHPCQYAEIRVSHPEKNRCFPRSSLRLENAYYPWTGHRWTTAIDRRLEWHRQVDRLSHLFNHQLEDTTQSSLAVARQRRRSLNTSVRISIHSLRQRGSGEGKNKSPPAPGSQWVASTGNERGHHTWAQDLLHSRGFVKPYAC